MTMAGANSTHPGLSFSPSLSNSFSISMSTSHPKIQHQHAHTHTYIQFQYVHLCFTFYWSRWHTFGISILFSILLSYNTIGTLFAFFFFLVIHALHYNNFGYKFYSAFTKKEQMCECEKERKKDRQKLGIWLSYIVALYTFMFHIYIVT